MLTLAQALKEGSRGGLSRQTPRFFVEYQALISTCFHLAMRTMFSRLSSRSPNRRALLWSLLEPYSSLSIWLHFRSAG
jgi:hypothetical protein